MKLTYSGNLESDLIRRVLGPDMYGGYLVVERTFYNPGTDRTTAFLRPLSPAEVPNITYDQYWQEYLAD